MKTAISIPDEVFAEADKLARSMKTSRSELYARAVAEFVARHAPDAVTEAMNRACEELGEARPETFGRRAARRTLERAEW